jgi:hypothetical protein
MAHTMNGQCQEIPNFFAHHLDQKNAFMCVNIIETHDKMLKQSAHRKRKSQPYELAVAKTRDNQFHHF